MFAGQDLGDPGTQTQRDDMWILSIPSFSWIEVDQGTDKASIPPPRAGHLCQVWDAQMIVLGGYNTDLGCDAPGIYVFNMSSLGWSNQFTAVTGKNALQGYNAKDKGSTGNPLAQQINQRGFGVNAGIEGSYGYAVPDAVQSVIGGAATGGATLTAPVQTPTQGPLATGKPQTYTMTGPDGATITNVINRTERRRDHCWCDCRCFCGYRCVLCVLRVDLPPPSPDLEVTCRRCANAG
jgi:hypothetical protein